MQVIHGYVMKQELGDLASRINWQFIHETYIFLWALVYL